MYKVNIRLFESNLSDNRPFLEKGRDLQINGQASEGKERRAAVIFLDLESPDNGHEGVRVQADRRDADPPPELIAEFFRGEPLCVRRQDKKPDYRVQAEEDEGGNTDDPGPERGFFDEMHAVPSEESMYILNHKQEDDKATFGMISLASFFICPGGT
jgi:hypothetical protein